MSRKTTLALSIIMAGAFLCTNANAIERKTGVKRTAPSKNIFGNASSQNDGFKMPYTIQDAPWVKARKEPAVITTEPSVTFGWLSAPGKSNWYYTQDLDITVDMSNGYPQIKYKGAEIKVYDDNHKLVGDIYAKVPEGIDVNMIEPHGIITNKLFDNDSKTYEIMVYLHQTGNKDNNYQGTDHTHIYRLDGTKIGEYIGSGDIFDTSKGYDIYQRFILIDLNSTVKSEDGTVKQMPKAEIYRPGTWGETGAQLEHTFTMDFDLLNYSDGPFINTFNIDGTPYYALAHYKQRYDEEGTSMDEDIVPTKNNAFIIETFDKKFNRVDSVSIPMVTPSNAYYRFAAFGRYSSKDFTKGYYSGDDKFNYIVTFYDYISSSDSYNFSFNVYDSDGKLINTICDNVVEDTWSQMTSIKGQSEQMMFLQTTPKGEQQVAMVDIPSCEKKTIIPARINNENIALPINRYPKGDSYQYVIKMAHADTDDNKNTIARLMWINPDLSFDRFTNFNLGPTSQMFSPYITNETMNPYIFNTDDELEYIFLSKEGRDGASEYELQNVYYVGKEDGTIIKRFEAEQGKSLTMAGIFAHTPINSSLYIMSTNNEDGTYQTQFYSLPFTSFEKGGDGTPENPYLISSAGDMMQINKKTNAHYKLANDIEMLYSGSRWSPIENFSGTINGDGHSINGLNIESDLYQSGLFSYANVGSEIKNMTIVNPTINITNANNYVGVIAGTATETKITNVHVVNADIKEPTGMATPAVGGLTGNATYFSEFRDCSFNGNIMAAGTSCVGGISGETKTSTNIISCATSGSYTADNTLGGVAGSTSRGCEVRNCHTSVTLTANNTVGGIVGDNEARGIIENCIAEGKITANQPTKWGGLHAGGIAGSLEGNYDWKNNKDTVIRHCIVNADIYIPAEEAKDATVHRVAGRTIADKEGSEDIEHGLDGNYALNTVTVGGKAIESDDETGLEGATKTASELNKSFLTSVNYNYGETSAAPWKEYGDLPILYFENTAKAIMLSNSNITVQPGATYDITATVYGTSADDIEVFTSDSEIAEVEITEIEDNKATLRISCKKDAPATVTVKAGNITAVCKVNETTGISNTVAENNDMKIRVTEGTIIAEGADKIAVYSINGTRHLLVSGDTVSTDSIRNGVYVIVATNANGNKTSCKVVIK
ncbi:GLUG motif-containing protein [Xylanibacter muris]|uniref:GLUG domain-containing protein n=1 Tax=Xylanibacter muris TaxID=2736290 RepID=A0ABX2APB0_9BACT|nr:GLUG motif-containing protein [Xylanibacter muris]NPD93083.1 hypothetical protein [Xylanibacter muris]